MPDTPERTDICRRLVETFPHGILLVRNERVELANQQALRLLAAPAAAQVVGRHLLEFFPPASHERLRDRLARRESPSAAPADETVTTLDGGTRSLEIDIAAADDSHLTLVLRDVTAQRRAEAAVRENEERLTLAFAGAREGVWDWNLETNAVVYSSRWKQMLGYADDEIEPHISAWERLVHPGDRSRADRAHDSVAEGAPTYEAEFRLRHKAGHYVHVLSRGFPLRREPGGPVVRIVGTHLDVTDRRRAEMALRESEERLTLAFEGAQEGVWDWDLETDAVVYSARWAEMLGYAQEEIEPHVRAWERLLHPDDRPRATELYDRVVHRGERQYEGEFRLRHKDGRYVHVLSRGFPVRRDPGGPVVRIVGTHFDLTERHEAEEARERQLAERARTEMLTRLVFAQEDERRRIAREMHDQFGEQLTALSRRIALLRAATGDDAELRTQIDALHEISLRIDRDVDHLVWQLRPTALDDLGLRAALADYVQQWGAREGIAAELHTSGLLDERLTRDAETTLYRIAQEALTNVAKHSRAAKVEVILERRDDQVLLIVEDDGVGFDTPPAGAAHGFGLLGMRERAALVGATLEIESAPGKGTTILLRMPGPAPPRVEHA